MNPPDRKARLASYLDQAAGARLVWGESDCAFGLVAGWIRAETGIEVGVAWRGRYRTALGCARLLKREGGLAAVCASAARMAGLAEIDPRTARPGLGDVGVVLAVDGRGRPLQAAAILAGIGWAGLGLRGLIIEPADCVRAWKVPEGASWPR